MRAVRSIRIRKLFQLQRDGWSLETEDNSGALRRESGKPISVGYYSMVGQPIVVIS